jgi:hypothetical protein
MLQDYTHTDLTIGSQVVPKGDSEANPSRRRQTSIACPPSLLLLPAWATVAVAPGAEGAADGGGEEVFDGAASAEMAAGGGRGGESGHAAGASIPISPHGRCGRWRQAADLGSRLGPSSSVAAWWGLGASRLVYRNGRSTGMQERITFFFKTYI